MNGWRRWLEQARRGFGRGQAHKACNPNRRQVRAETIVDRLPGVVYRMDRSTRTLSFLSQGAHRIFGGGGALKAESTFEVIIHPDDRVYWQEALDASVQDGQRYELLYRLAPGIGWHQPVTWVLDRGIMRQRPQGDVLEGLLLDMTGHQHHQAELIHAAEHDAITGVLNRQPFIELLERAAKRSETGALLYFDIVRYNAINRSLGYQAGDELLEQVAKRLQGCLMEGAVIGRLGADEFAVYLAQCEQRHTTLARIMSALKPDYRVGQQALTVDITAGVTVGLEHDANTALQHARLALQHARSMGRLYEEFDPGLLCERDSPLKLEQALRNALLRDELSLDYQVQIDASSGDIAGVEALMRWRHAQFGNVSPLQFIPLAEEMGLIAELGRWCLTTACDQLAQWDEQGVPVPRISVNLSTLQLTPALVDQVEALLTRFALSPKRLELEVTETQLIQNLALSHHVLQALRDKGVAIALDDFGTGYSSLAYLASLPIDRLKIDKRFVDGVPERGPERGVIAAVISMAHALSLEVIVEGVETEQQWHYLKTQNCHVLQGYYFGAPVSAQVFAEYVRTHTLQ